ncbi:MMPL family transporter [Dactylosporangium sp. CA-139114]|uniref:MMPL family transporter n=1 Tax=Dactylosporangium sp. CA-139114 TaxID=3239931 RepID=UPI003D998705
MPKPRPAPAGERANFFVRLAGWSQRHRWWSLAAWVLVLVAVTAGAQAAGSDYHNDYSLPGTESQAALDTLRAQAPADAGDSVQIVLQDPDGLPAPAVQDRVQAMLGRVRNLPHVVDVRSPYDDRSAISRDDTIGYATVTLDGTKEDVPAPDVRTIIDTAKAAGTGGLRVELGGGAVSDAEQKPGGAAEGAGMLAALVILVVLFGSLLAAALPIVVAVFAVGATTGLIILASHVVGVADFTVSMMSLVGLGVGIDYALLVFSRYRAELTAGATREQATRTALDTAGRTVMFAGGTVIIALMGLVALGLGSLRGVAVAVAITVALTVVASLTLLPALLTVFGRRFERTVQRRAGRRRRTEGAGWRRWSGLIRRSRWTALLLPFAALLALAAPAIGLRLGFADAGSDPQGSTSRAAYDLLAEGFGPGFSGPLVVVVKGDVATAGAAADAVRTTPGVAAVLPPRPVAPGLATFVVFPNSKPQDAATGRLATRLREQVLPPLAHDHAATFLVGGSTAATQDYAAAVASRLPLFVTIVVGLSSLLLMLVFRSVLIPVKAALLNLLSVGASLGVITVVFQHGTFGMQPGPIEAYVPVMNFAVVFGLSMDYEVFLLSRMHERWERDRDPGAAVDEGLATTGRVVTAAAAIMIVVFGAFMLSPERVLQQFGLGLASAVFLDAVVIRCLILPATMHLLGARAWWLPARLARWLPTVGITGERPAARPVEMATADGGRP